MLEVTLPHPDNTRVVFDDIEYVSLYNAETYGPPPLIAPVKPNESGTRAGTDEPVLYINTAVVPWFEITRTSE